MMAKSVLVSISSLFSWAIMCILLIWKASLSQHILVYLLVFVLPLNTLTNPILKTFITKQVIEKARIKKKKGVVWSKQTTSRRHRKDKI